MQLKNYPVINANDEVVDTIQLSENGTLGQASAKLEFKYGSASAFLTFGKPIVLPHWFSVQYHADKIDKSDSLQVWGYECAQWDDVKKVIDSVDWKREFSAHGYNRAVFCPPLKTLFCFK